MGTRIEEVRKKTLVNRFAQVVDEASPTTIHDQISLRTKIFDWKNLNARKSNEHLWKLKLINFYDTVASASTARQRQDQYRIVEKAYKENIDFCSQADANNYSLNL